VAGTTYYWQVTARNSGGTTTGSMWSFTTAPVAPPPGTLPPGWDNRDIGSVGTAGSAAYSSGVFSVSGAGTNIDGRADSFQFAFEAISGNTQIVARVATVQNTHRFAKAGVMIRESLAPGSTNVLVNVRPDGTVEFSARTRTNAQTATIATSPGALPTWIRLI